MDLSGQIARLVGASSVEVLAARLAKELGDQRRASPTDPNGLLIDLARREHAIGPADSGVTLEAAITAMSSIDPRIPVMVAIAKQLGLPTSALVSHEDFVKRLYEDSRLVGREPQGDLSSIILSIVKRCEPGVDQDDLELFVEGGQPSLFFYETARAFLEAAGESADREDEEEIEEEEEEGEEVDQPVRASVKTFLVQSLVLMVDEKQLDIEPAWQRTDVWSLKKKRKLIKSLILGIPLPSIILHSRAGRMSIIDGKQRLLSILKFVKNEWKLPKYDVPSSSPLYACRGVFYDKQPKPSLPDERKGEFRMREVPALVFEDVSEARLRSIFHLYNVAGMKLNAAEIRNAVYQANPIHRVLYVLAGEGHGRTDLEIGGLDVQESFKKGLRSAYPGANRRYQGVDFLARYLGYSRAAQADLSKQFGAPSTSRAINNYFDRCSDTEDAKAVAKEIIEVFNATPKYFDAGDDRLAFFTRGPDGRRKFSKLAATTHMVGTRLLLHLKAKGVIDDAKAQAASAMVDIEVPAKQQSATIWDYQARVMLGLRDALGEETVAEAGDGWPAFLQKMEFCRLPPEEVQA